MISGRPPQEVIGNRSSQPWCLALAHSYSFPFAPLEHVRTRTCMCDTDYHRANTRLTVSLSDVCAPTHRQLLGNHNSPILNVDEANVRARAALPPAFEAVIALNPPSSLFPWKKVSKLPIGSEKKNCNKSPENLLASIRALGGRAWTAIFPEKNLTDPTQIPTTGNDLSR